MVNKMIFDRKIPKKAIMQLVKLKIYGNTPEAVIVYLVRRGIDDLMRCGVIKP